MKKKNNKKKDIIRKIITNHLKKANSFSEKAVDKVEILYYCYQESFIYGAYRDFSYIPSYKSRKFNTHKIIIYSILGIGTVGIAALTALIGLPIEVLGISSIFSILVASGAINNSIELKDNIKKTLKSSYGIDVEKIRQEVLKRKKTSPQLLTSQQHDEHSTIIPSLRNGQNVSKVAVPKPYNYVWYPIAKETSNTVVNNKNLIHAKKRYLSSRHYTKNV